MDSGQPSASVPAEPETATRHGHPRSDSGTGAPTEGPEEAQAQAQAQARDADALRRRFRALRRAVPPCSEREQYIVRARHELMKTVLDGALTASRLPPDLGHVVDVGCGFGPWAADMARQFPGARVTGADLAPIAAAPAAPANLRFVVADANAPWSAFAAPASLDLVHMRALTESIADWPFALGQAFGALRPGGVVEINELRPVFFDFDGQFAVTAVFPELLDMYLQLAAAIGIDLDPIPKLPGWLNDAGFEKIAQRSEILPLGLWPKDEKLRRRAELFTDLMMSGGWESKTQELFLSGGWDAGRFTALMDEVKADTQAAKTKIYVTVVITTCRKPAAERE